jgi:hypothetical protein
VLKIRTAIRQPHAVRAGEVIERRSVELPLHPGDNLLERVSARHPLDPVEPAGEFPVFLGVAGADGRAVDDRGGVLDYLAFRLLEVAGGRETLPEQPAASSWVR